MYYGGETLNVKWLDLSKVFYKVCPAYTPIYTHTYTVTQCWQRATKPDHREKWCRSGSFQDTFTYLQEEMAIEVPSLAFSFMTFHSAR